MADKAKSEKEAKTDASLAAERKTAGRTSEGTVSAKPEASKKPADKRESAVKAEAKKSDPENVVTDNILGADENAGPITVDDELRAPANPFKVPKELPATHLVEDDDPEVKGEKGPEGIPVEAAGPVLKSPEDFKKDAKKFPEREELDQDNRNPSMPRLESDRAMLQKALEMKDVPEDKGAKEAPMSRPLPEDTLAKKQMQENVHRGLAEDTDVEKRKSEADLGEKVTDEDEQPYQRPLAEDREAWKRRRGTLEKERGPEPV